MELKNQRISCRIRSRFDLRQHFAQAAGRHRLFEKKFWIAALRGGDLQGGKVRAIGHFLVEGNGRRTAFLRSIPLYEVAHGRMDDTRQISKKRSFIRTAPRTQSTAIVCQQLDIHFLDDLRDPLSLICAMAHSRPAIPHGEHGNSIVKRFQKQLPSLRIAPSASVHDIRDGLVLFFSHSMRTRLGSNT